MLLCSQVITFHVPNEAMLPSHHSSEHNLIWDTTSVQSYCSETHKLDLAGYTAKSTLEEAHKTAESKYMLHHMMHHNSKNRISFNCSSQYKIESLNSCCLSQNWDHYWGPEVFSAQSLSYCQNAVAVSGDICMFHQVYMLAGNQPILCFLWTSMQGKMS